MRQRSLEATALVSDAGWAWTQVCPVGNTVLALVFMQAGSFPALGWKKKPHHPFCFHCRNPLGDVRWRQLQNKSPSCCQGSRPFPRPAASCLGGEWAVPEQDGCVLPGLIPPPPQPPAAPVGCMCTRGWCTPPRACAHRPVQGAPSCHILCCPEPASTCRLRFEFPGRCPKAAQLPVNFLTWLRERQRARTEVAAGSDEKIVMSVCPGFLPVCGGTAAISPPQGPSSCRPDTTRRELGAGAGESIGGWAAEPHQGKHVCSCPQEVCACVSVCGAVFTYTYHSKKCRGHPPVIRHRELSCASVFPGGSPPFTPRAYQVRSSLHLFSDE